MIEWPKTIAEARRFQESLSAKVTLSRLRTAVKTVAGVDAAYSGDKTVAAVALYDLKTLSCIEESHHVEATRFPYVPGYLSFREGPAMLAAIAALHEKPDIILVDGQGIAHPRRLGIASFLGVLLGMPAIGCAKSRLVGEYLEPPAGRGEWSALYYNGETVGAVLRSRERVKPLFVSPGHLVTLAESLELVLRCCPRYRLPEPIRHADALSKRLKREHAG
ncbi:MAG: deoxyribonuclease V [Geobacteraceae bacterium]|nr:deoxyribonuclease V [Geobacteraceae bacterium]